MYSPFISLEFTSRARSSSGTLGLELLRFPVFRQRLGGPIWESEAA